MVLICVQDTPIVVVAAPASTLISSQSVQYYKTIKIFTFMGFVVLYNHPAALSVLSQADYVSLLVICHEVLQRGAISMGGGLIWIDCVFFWNTRME